MQKYLLGTALLFCATATSQTSSPPLEFFENAGQWDSTVHYLARRGPMTAWFAKNGWTIALDKNTADRLAVRMTFVGTDGAKSIERLSESSARHTYISRRGAYRSRGYRRLRYKSLYEGVDLVLRDNGRSFEYDLCLEPGAKISDIVIRCEGIQGLRVDADGSLVMKTGLGELKQAVPPTWAIQDGKRITVACGYRKIDEHSFGFWAERWDSSLPLVIDPGLLWSSYFGGTGNERINAVQRGKDGKIYIAGFTSSTALPKATGKLKGKSDAFVACVDPSKAPAMQQLWATWFGGTGDDAALDMAIDATGASVTITGYTASKDIPVTTGAFQAAYGGGSMDAFVAQLTSNGSKVSYCSYYGGKDDDWASAISLDAKAGLHLTGVTYSKDLPTTSGAYQSKLNGLNDLFVCRIDPTKIGKAQLAWSTYLGGKDDEGEWITFPNIVLGLLGADIAVDNNGKVIVASRTTSRDFPVVGKPFQKLHGGGATGTDYDCVVVKLDSSQTGKSQLVASTFVGGTGTEGAVRLAVENDGRVTIGGYTASKDYPTTTGAYNTTYNGGTYDWFVTRLDPSLGSQVFSTFLGGKTNREYMFGLAVESSGAVILGGYAFSTDFPTTRGSFRPTPAAGPFDAVVSRLSPDGSKMHYSSHIGGSGPDLCLDLVSDHAGGVILVGLTLSSNFPVHGGFQISNGGQEGFIANMDLLPAGTTRIGKPQTSCNGAIYLGVTLQARRNVAGWALTSTGTAPSSVGLILAGTKRRSTAQKTVGLDLWIDLAASFTFLVQATDARGYGEKPMPMHLLPSGSRFYFQYFAFNPGACNPHLLSSSNALEVIVQ